MMPIGKVDLHLYKLAHLQVGMARGLYTQVDKPVSVSIQVIMLKSKEVA